MSKIYSIILVACACACVAGPADAANLTLAWDPSPSPARGYILKYGNASGSYNQQIDVGNSLFFSVPGLLEGQTYYFAVCAYDDSGHLSAPSNEVNATVPSSGTETLSGAASPGAAVQSPAPTDGTVWYDADVGFVLIPGSVSEGAAGLNITGNGADIWGSADAFHFMFHQQAGDGDMVARVTAIQDTNSFAKAGVMFRNSLADNSAHVILDVRPSGEIEFMTRTADGADTTYLTGRLTSFPAWLMLSRRAHTTTGYTSTDGTNWVEVGSVTETLSDNVLSGLIVTSHDVTKANQSSFDLVTASK